MKADLVINSTNPICAATTHEKTSKAPQGISSRVNAVFERAIHYNEHLKNPLSFIATGLAWGGLIQSIEHYSGSALYFITEFTQPCQIITLINDVKKVSMLALGFGSEGKALIIKPAELTALGFSMISRCCKTLSWLQNLGMITPAVAAAWRISFIGTVCSLMSASVDLGDNVVHYSSPLRLAKAFLNFTASAVAVYLFLQVSVQLHILFLMLTTGTLFLSVVTAIH